MKNNGLLYFFLLLCFACGAQSAEDGKASVEAIRQLGSREADNFALVKQLACDPLQNSKALVAELQTIQASEITEGSEAAEHLIWVCRALKYITGGMEFFSTSSAAFESIKRNEDRRYWLTFKSGGAKISLFALWPSRDKTYLAPIEAQREIAAQWCEWSRNKSKEFKFRPLSDPKPEEWLW